MNRHTPGATFLASVFLIALLHTSCGESFINQAAFSQIEDTIFLDASSWYYFRPEAELREEVPMFPFSFQIFDVSGKGFLLKSANRIYYLDFGKPLNTAYVFLDNQAEIGDTLSKFSDRHYHLLIDKKTEKLSGEDIYYILRRSKKGVGTLEERSVWVVSEERGVLAVSNHDIDDKSGVVTLDIIGEPHYFRESSFIPRIKFYDFERAYHVDRERNIIYTFEKHSGKLKSKNFERGEELYEYQFARGRMSKLVNFYIESEAKQIKLVAEDSCFIFNDILELQYSSICE